jgi:hypothetical protein
MKHKIALFLASISFLALNSQIFGYVHTFVNGTPYEATVTVGYNICKDEQFLLSSGETKDINAGACLLKSITSQLRTIDGQNYFPVTPYARSTFGYAGTATWTIIGPIYAAKDNYRIWRVGLGLEEKQ